MDDEAIPTGELVAVPPAPWDHWVVFTEPEQALCIEPQSGPPNEFHIAPQVVRPGETMTHYMRLAWA